MMHNIVTKQQGMRAIYLFLQKKNVVNYCMIFSTQKTKINWTFCYITSENPVSIIIMILSTVTVLLLLVYYFTTCGRNFLIT